eukprot:795565_1
MGMCNGNWYLDLVYSGTHFSQSQPKKIAICVIAKINQTIKGTPAPTEAIDAIIAQKTTEAEYLLAVASMAKITMLLGLVFLIFLLARTCSKTKLDWYRLIAIYIIATLGVPISIALGPQDGGFNRILGFGILIHNLGELFIINHVYYGSPGQNGNNRFSAIYAIFYIWIVMAFITFLEPLWVLFLILMLQGSFCDWTLVGTFIYLGTHAEFKVKEKCACCCGLQMNYGMFGIFAAITHILSIQPLFYMMALPNFQAGGAVTIILLMPTFILYILFSSANPNTVPRIIQSMGYRHINLELNMERNDLLKDIKNGTKPLNNELKQRNVSDNQVENETYENKENKESDVANDIKVAMDGDSSGKAKDTIFDIIINTGLYHMDNGKHYKPMCIIFMIAAITCTANSLIVLFAPCYITPPDCGFD